MYIFDPTEINLCSFWLMRCKKTEIQANRQKKKIKIKIFFSHLRTWNAKLIKKQWIIDNDCNEVINDNYYYQGKNSFRIEVERRKLFKHWVGCGNYFPFWIVGCIFKIHTVNSSTKSWSSVTSLRRCQNSKMRGGKVCSLKKMHTELQKEKKKKGQLYVHIYVNPPPHTSKKCSYKAHIT